MDIQNHRRDRNTNRGGIMLYVKEGMPCKMLKPQSNDKNGRFLIVDINLRKEKWLLVCDYNPHIKFINPHIKFIKEHLKSFLYNMCTIYKIKK